MFGGNANAQGAFASTSPALNRIQAKIDAALLPEWKNTRVFEAEIVVPQGTELNIGALRHFMWIWPDRTGGPPGCQSDRSWR